MSYQNRDLPPAANPYPQAFRVAPAAYAKGKYTVTPLDSRDGWKGPASIAADEVKARYVNRSHGYQMSPRQYERFIVAYERIIAETAANR